MHESHFSATKLGELPNNQISEKELSFFGTHAIRTQLHEPADGTRTGK